MADTYVDMISKLQQQGLDALKQAQDNHIKTIAAARDIVTKVASAPVPTIESLPSVTTLTELTATFATQVLEQQKAYATQLAGLFDAALARKA